MNNGSSKNMYGLYKKFLALTLLFSSSMLLISCTSSGPATSYYSLFSTKSSSSINNELKSELSVGVALVNLPGYLDTSAIVSRTNGQKLNLSGFHAWAEPLDEAITRTLAGDLRQQLLVKNVLAFPWDIRVRPDLQLKIDIEQFDGIRGNTSKLSANWSVYSVSKKEVLFSGVFDEQVSIEGNDYEAYVTALNSLLQLFSVDISSKIDLQ